MNIFMQLEKIEVASTMSGRVSTVSTFEIKMPFTTNIKMSSKVSVVSEAIFPERRARSAARRRYTDSGLAREGRRRNAGATIEARLRCLKVLLDIKRDCFLVDFSRRLSSLLRR